MQSPIPPAATVDKRHIVVGSLGETKVRLITIIHSYIRDRLKAKGQGELMANRRLRLGSVISARGMVMSKRIILIHTGSWRMANLGMATTII